MDKNRIGIEVVYIELEGEKYPLVFNLGALIEIDREYGYQQFICAIKERDIKAIKLGLRAGNKEIDLSRKASYKDREYACIKILEGIVKNMPETDTKTSQSNHKPLNINMFELYYYLGIMHAGLSKKEVLASSIKELYLFLDIKNKLVEKKEPKNKPNLEMIL